MTANDNIRHYIGDLETTEDITATDKRRPQAVTREAETSKGISKITLFSL